MQQSKYNYPPWNETHMYKPTRLKKTPTHVFILVVLNIAVSYDWGA